MKNLIKIMIFLFPLFFFSQIKEDTIYIMYNPKIDKHCRQKNKFHYFDIYLTSNKKIKFSYGRSIPRKRVKNIYFPIINRNQLSKIIKNDSRYQVKVFYVIKKEKDMFVLYRSDHLFRAHIHDVIED